MAAIMLSGPIRCRTRHQDLRADSVRCRSLCVLTQLSLHSLAGYSEICLYSEDMWLDNIVFLLCRFHIGVMECRGTHM